MNFRCFYDFQGMIIFYDYYCVASVVLLRNNYDAKWNPIQLLNGTKDRQF